MAEEKKINEGRILYISEYGSEENETVIHALAMPVSVTVFIDNDGTADIEFREQTESGNCRRVCRTGVVPDITPPCRFRELKEDLNLEENVSKAIAGWITVFMRDGVFCTNKKENTFLNFLDLRNIAERVQENLEEVYTKYSSSYQ